MSIRPYEPRDVDQVLALHRQGMLGSGEPSPAFASYLATFYGETLFDHPWRDDDLPSLVYERDDGSVLGFLGVVPRPAVIDERPVRVAVSVRLLVDQDDPRAAAAGATLQTRFMRGPQDASLVENANAVSRRLWEASRGARVLPTASVSWCSDPAFAPPEPQRGWTSHDADDAELLQLVHAASEGMAFRPTYDQRTLGWLFRFLETASYRGTLHRRVVTDKAGLARGWYVFYANPSGYNGVLALRAGEGATTPVFRSLLADVRSAGGADVTMGRLQAEFTSTLAEHGCTLAFGPWAVAHTHDERIAAALATGDAYLTRLEGEFC